MTDLKTAMVVNGCTADRGKQLRQLFAFTEENEISTELTVILSNDLSAEKELLVSVWTKKTAVVRLGAYFAETAADILGGLLADYRVVLFPDNIFGADMSARLACRMYGSRLNRLRTLRPQCGKLVCSRAVYSNLAYADYEVEAFPFYCTVSSAPSHRAPERRGGPACDFLDRTAQPPPAGILRWREERSAETDAMENAKLVFVFGRGIQSEKILREGLELARLLGAGYGVTKPVAMDGWAPLSRIVGVSGLQIAPDVCIVVGASCAGALYAGIEHSATIININTDDSENLRDRSDVLVVGDCGEILASIRKHCRKEKQK